MIPKLSRRILPTIAQIAVSLAQTTAEHRAGPNAAGAGDVISHARENAKPRATPIVETPKTRNPYSDEQDVLLMAQGSPFILQLILTEECNLRCPYCFIADKNPRRMPVELAKQLIDRELSQDGCKEEFEIELCGGEPFLAFEELKEIVEYSICNASRWGKRFYFFICSNLMPLDDNIKNWLEQRRCWVVLGTSLDGTKEAHDLNRCGSYDAVALHIPFYRRLYPTQGVKMTIGPHSVSSIYDSIIHIQSMGLSVSANVVYEPVWGDGEIRKKHLIRFAGQLELLVEYYAEHPSAEVPNLLSLPIRLFTEPQAPDKNWCGSGKNMRAYDTDGRVLPCHRFSRSCTLKVYEEGRSVGPRIQNQCDACRFASACPTCAAYNWEKSSHPRSRTSFHCEFIKLQLLATAKLIFLRNKSLVSDLGNEGSDAVKNVPKETLADLCAVNIVMHTLNVDEIISAAAGQ